MLEMANLTRYHEKRYVRQQTQRSVDWHVLLLHTIALLFIHFLIGPSDRDLGWMIHLGKVLF